MYAREGLTESESSSPVPFISVERVTALPSFAPGSSWLHDACVLPGAIFLETGVGSIPVPAIAYGSADMAFSCFEEGAADFMREGWTMLELEARLYRLWQPKLVAKDGFIALRGDILIREGGRLIDSVSSLRLTPTESALLRRFLAAPGRVVAPESLVLPGASPHAATRAQGMVVSRLKAKLSRLEPGLGECIRSVRGVGHLWINH